METDMRISKPVIAYGAGQYAPAAIQDLKKLGIEPVCFCDKDHRKQHTRFLGYEVLSLEAARDRYPDFCLYLTLSEILWDSISEELIIGGLVSESQILNKRIGKQYRSCFALEHELTTGNGFLYPCCIPATAKPRVPLRHGDYEKTIAEYAVLRDDVVALMNGGKTEPVYCKDCPFSQKANQYWMGNRKIRVLNIADSGVCQFDCIYCTNAGRAGNMSDLSLPDYGDLLDALQKQSLIVDDPLIKIGPDEITAHPKRDEILSVFEGHACEIFTNAAIYSDKVQDCLRHEHSSLLVSMDCGTRGTFAGIKKADVFGRVCENLKKYSANGGKIKLKYILLPEINDNMADADGFIELCKDVNAMCVMLSYNKNDKRPMPDKTIEIAKYIKERAETEGFMVNYVDIFLGDEATSRIKVK
jgi:hypothetical protein